MLPRHAISDANWDRIKDACGKYRSNVIWVNPEYEGPVSAATIARLVKDSNR